MAKRIVIFSVLLTVAGCSVYGDSSPPATPRASASRTTVSAAASVSLTSAHIALIHDHFGSRPSAGPGNGRGRNGGLPPGIARNLQRGKSLPPGIAKQSLPRDLLVRLPRAPTGLEYVVVAGKLLLVDAATAVVREVLLETVFG